MRLFILNIRALMLLLGGILFFYSLPSFADSELDLMPYPHQLTVQTENLTLDDNFYVVLDKNASPLFKAEVQRFIKRLNAQTSLNITAKPRDHIQKKSPANYLRIVIEKSDKPTKPERLADDESYQLKISSDHIYLHANNRVGAVRGLETLLQVIGLQSAATQAGKIVIPQLAINDAPRFKWRGVLLDSSRHFLSIDTLKRQIDAMAAAKFNVFHWHLTDDQGWRFESKAYPKLHQLASDGEYYSQQQMRDIVSYAQQRGIHVLPEIDLPGHASAIALVYPKLMSAPGPYQRELRWGVHKPTLNPTDEKVFQFVDALMKEVSALFPFEYIHIGGDEVDPEHWQNNAAIQKFMQDNQLENTQALQAYFNRRMVKILSQHQRKMIGWDEIQHPDLPKDIVIQSWQGPDAVSDAISHGFQAILSTGYYLDQPQPAGYHYRNDPMPEVETVDDQIKSGETWQTFAFEIPRKRGSAITGSFTLIADKHNRQRGFIDFTGKSRRALQNLHSLHGIMRFELDTWMGVFKPRITMIEGKLTGEVIVGNLAYPISGEQIAGSTMSKNTLIPAQAVRPSIGKTERQLVLGGEAALWAELVDESVIDLRLWPRAFVVGERLWSAAERRDEDSMYRRMEKISRWSELSVGLLHRQQARTAMQKFVAAGQSIEPLEVFAQAIEQVQYYHRHHEKHVHGSYSKADELTLFVDSLPAESVKIRELDQLVTRFIAEPENKITAQQLTRFLQAWIDNHQAVEKLIKTNPALKEMDVLAQRVHEVSLLGLRLIDHLVHKKPLSPTEISHARKQLQQAQKVHQEIVVSAAYPIERLLDAAY